MLCVGDDDRQYGDENGRKEQHGQAEISSRVQLSATKQSK